MHNFKKTQLVDNQHLYSVYSLYYKYSLDPIFFFIFYFISSIYIGKLGTEVQKTYN